MKKRGLYIICIAIGLSSCWNNSTFKGYTETSSGLLYKLQSIGEGKIKPSPGDYLLLFISYKTEADSVFFDTYSINETGKVILPFQHSSFIGSFEEGLMNMNSGDSVSFVVDADSLFLKFFKAKLPLFLKSGSKVKMDVKLHTILSEKEYRAEVEKYKKIVDDRDIEEHRKFELFLDTCSTPFFPLENGMFYLPVKQGTGDFPEQGDVVKIQYKGFFLNGKQFESTYDRVQPLEFTIGEQGQVIKGIETAISLMNEGSKTKFIIPSQLAFGESGSSTNIVPPYSTVIYEIELLNLTKK